MNRHQNFKHYFNCKTWEMSVFLPYAVHVGSGVFEFMFAHQSDLGDVKNILYHMFSDRQLRFENCVATEYFTNSNDVKKNLIYFVLYSANPPTVHRVLTYDPSFSIVDPKKITPLSIYLNKPYGVITKGSFLYFPDFVNCNLFEVIKNISEKYPMLTPKILQVENIENMEASINQVFIVADQYSVVRMVPVCVYYDDCVLKIYKDNTRKKLKD